MKALLALFFWLVPGLFAVYGQLVQTARAEIPVPSFFSAFEVWPQPDSTVLVLHIEPDARRTSGPFMLLKFDANLERIWQTPVTVPPGSKFEKAAFQNRSGYLLFLGNKSREYHLVLVDSRTGDQVISTHLLPEKMTFTPTGLAALHGYLYLTGTQNGRLVVLHLDPAQKEINKLPALYDQSSNMTEFLADTLAGRMEFVQAESNGRRMRLQVKRLTPDGRLLSLSFLQAPDRNFLGARLVPGDSAHKVLAGAYSPRDLRYAQGFFVAPLVLPPGEKPKYHDFTTFSHYFDHLKPRRQSRLRQKIGRMQLSRKTYQLRHRILLHPVQPYPGGFLLTGELYYPHYSGDAGNRIFDGFQHTAAIVAAFDKGGNLLWENAFPLQNQRFFELQESVSVTVIGHRVLMAYPDHAKIRYKLFQNGQATPNDQFLENGPGPEKTIRVAPEGVKTWFGNNVLTFGIQQLKGAPGRREVFYLSRLTAN